MIVEGLGIAVAKAAYDMHKSDKLNEQAQKRMVRSFSKIAEAQAEQKEMDEKMKNAVLRLTNRKKAVLSTSMKDFLTVYEKIIKINFTESDGIKELKNFSPAIVEEINTQISVVRNMPAMPTISKNVVIGYLIGGVIGAVTSSIVDDSKRNYDLARMQSRQADVIVQQSEGIVLAYQAIYERALRLTDVLTKLNILFREGIRYTDQLIELRGTDKRAYSLEERKSLAACINVAGAVKNILDVPIIDYEGQITQKSIEVILLGEQYIQDVKFIMEN